MMRSRPVVSSSEPGAGAGPLDPLVDHRVPVYAGGLAVVVGARLAPVPDAVRLGVVALAVGVMALTYVGERLPAGAGVPRPVVLVVGLAGVTVGTVLVGTVGPAGFVVVAGGLLFLHGATSTGEPT